MGQPARREGFDREAYIAAVREALGERSQNAVAAEIPCSQAYVSAWLLGRVPAREFLLRLAAVTGTDPDRLLGPAGYPGVAEGSVGEWFLGEVRRLAAELGRPLMVTVDDLPEEGESRERAGERVERLRVRSQGTGVRGQAVGGAGR